MNDFSPSELSEADRQLAKLCAGDTFTEDDLITADVVRNVDKGSRLANANDASALEQQVQMWRANGGM